jgi:predicted NUDIX family NTP pyrophosphohydrolase
VKRLSAGILMYRRAAGRLEVFLVHPGGPYWAGKDAGAWSIPKGEHKEGEDPLAAARREFREETGFSADGPFTLLGTVRQPSGKLVTAWATEGNSDPALLRSNTFSLEWPPGSGKQAEFPEVDRGAWFGVGEAKAKLHKGQVSFLERLCEVLGAPGT